MPGNSDRVLSAFNSLVDSSRFPRYLEPFTPERIKPVPAPTAEVAQREQVLDAGESVVKILGIAASCSRTLEGSGFVYDDERVMTNAHVVAGVDRPIVRIDDVDYRARIVYYDPDVDVAVLEVPDLDKPALDFAASAHVRRPGRRARLPGERPVRRPARPDPGEEDAAQSRTSTATRLSTGRSTRSTPPCVQATPVDRSSTSTATSSA